MNENKFNRLKPNTNNFYLLFTVRQFRASKYLFILS